MERANAGFLVVVALAVVVGAVTATGYGGELQARDESSAVVAGLEVDVTDAAVRDGTLEVTVTTTNPTDHELALTGTTVRVHNRSEETLAFGTATVLSGDTTLAPGGSATATYRVRVSPSGLPALRAALAEDADVTVTHSVRLRGISVSVTRADPAPLVEGR